MMLVSALAVLTLLKVNKTEYSHTSTPSRFKLFTKKIIVLRSICLNVGTADNNSLSLTMRNAMWGSSLTRKWASILLSKLITSLSRLNWLNKKILILKSTRRILCSSTPQPMAPTMLTGGASLSRELVKFVTGLSSLNSKASLLTSKILPRMLTTCSHLKSRGSMMLSSTRILNAETGRENTLGCWTHHSWQSQHLKKLSRNCIKTLDNSHSSQWER